jgi:hypothetical protein
VTFVTGSDEFVEKRILVVIDNPFPGIVDSVLAFC